jgi:hypothetical protein
MNLLALGFGVVFIGLGCLNIYGFIKINKINIKKISEISKFIKEEVIISGTVLPDKTILSPITQTPCVYCLFQTFERGMRYKSGFYGKATNILGSGSVGGDFLLQDETGTIELNSEKAVGFELPTNGYYDNDYEFKDKITQFKVKYGIGDAADREYWETLILPNDKIWVLCKTNPGEKAKAVEIYSKNPKEMWRSPVRIITTIIFLVMGILLLSSV